MMNIKVLCLGLVLFTGFCITQNSFAKSTVQTVSNDQFVVLEVQNMSCAMCKFTIKKALQAVDGVKTVTINLDKKTASIAFNAQKTTIEALVKSTTHAGYPATVQLQK